METTNEILDSASHDCPLVAQTYSTAAAKGTRAPASRTGLGKGPAGAGSRRARAARAAPAPAPALCLPPWSAWPTRPVLSGQGVRVLRGQLSAPGRSRPLRAESLLLQLEKRPRLRLRWVRVTCAPAAARPRDTVLHPPLPGVRPGLFPPARLMGPRAFGGAPGPWRGRAVAGRRPARGPPEASVSVRADAWPIRPRRSSPVSRLPPKSSSPHGAAP